jgi:hypothetical protein
MIEGMRSRSFFLIDAVLSPDDISPTWARIADEVRSRLQQPARSEPVTNDRKRSTV